MSNTTFFVAIVSLALILLIVFIKEKFFKKKEYFPSGKEMLSDTQLLGLSSEELKTWQKEDLSWLICYVRGQMNSDDMKELWGELYTNASEALERC